MTLSALPIPPSLVRVAQQTTVVLALLYVLGVVVQLFAIGMVVLAGEAGWLSYHVNIGHGMGTFMLLLPIAALLGRLPRRLLLFTGLLFFLHGMQYFFVNSGGEALPMLRALHAVNALLLFVGAIHLAQGARRVGAEG